VASTNSSLKERRPTQLTTGKMIKWLATLETIKYLELGGVVASA